MPDIDPAALSRSDSFSLPLSAPLLPLKVNGTSTPASQKSAKIVNSAQRIDLEPLYIGLKSAIGDQWNSYAEAVKEFILGKLNESELSLRIDHFICADPTTEHLHNQIIAGIYCNVVRDVPDQAVAPWVFANDKPTLLSKPVSGDAAEQRLKAEVMQLPSRDRRRIKEVPEQPELLDPFATIITEYHQAKQIKLPDTVPASAGGLNKTNWDLEIRKRYSQPLASETGEFPDPDTIHSRMVPICYEEALPNGCAAPCAEYMATATEQFIKEVLSAVFHRTRSNMRGSSGLGIKTARYKRQWAKEEEAWLRGESLKGGGVGVGGTGKGLLPVEIREGVGRQPLGMGDLKLALQVGDCYLGQMPMVVEKILGGWAEGEVEELRDEQRIGLHGEEQRNGYAGGERDEESTDEEENDWGWEGAGKADREALDKLLDDCLAVGQ